MKLEVGMFIRTKDGMIYKNYGGGTNFFGDTVIYVNGENNLYDSVINVDIKKASFNLIDLIEVGDYVNGYCVDSVHNNEIITTQLIDTSWSDEDCNGEMVYYDETELVRIEPYEIHTILTHEQYEANCYKVGE